MKIVDRKTFLAMPEGTVYSKFTPMVFGELCVKGKTYQSDGDAGDFLFMSIVDAIDHSSSEDFIDKIEAAKSRGESLAMDFEAEYRDGMFDEEQLFAVWETQDVFALIARLHRTLPNAGELAESKKYSDVRQVVMCDPVVYRVMHAGGNASDAIVALANQKNALIARVMELESIAPKKIRIGPDSVMVWHCPDHLVPEMPS